MMSKVAICHPSFTNLGGAESVCMNIVEALSTEYDVVLISTTNPDIKALNKYFNTDVSGVETRQIQLPNRIAGSVSAFTERTIGTDVPRLRESLFKRRVQQLSDEFDYVISTRNEMCISDNESAQYIHLPRGGIIYNLGREELPESNGDVPKYIRMYDLFCKRIERYNPSCISDSTLITNSEWTGDLIERIYGVSPQIVHPPVDNSEFSPVPWKDRENGFVMIGKICQEKNILKAIQVIDRLRSKGHKVHLHIIGPEGDSNYADQVRLATNKRQYVDLMGKVSRTRLIRTICTHRYGFHAMDEEHFGMAVAELITGGAIPFVPNSGGQKYIVNNALLTYDSITEAVTNAERVLTDESLQRKLHFELLRQAKKYQKTSFHENIRSIIDRKI